MLRARGAVADRRSWASKSTSTPRMPWTCSARTDVDAVLILEHAVDDEERLLDDDEAIAREEVRADDDVGDAGLVLEREEHEALRPCPGRWRVMTMPATRTRRPCRARSADRARAARRASRARRAASAIGWRPDAQARAGVIGDQPLRSRSSASSGQSVGLSVLSGLGARLIEFTGFR